MREPWGNLWPCAVKELNGCNFLLWFHLLKLSLDLMEKKAMLWRIKTFSRLYRTGNILFIDCYIISRKYWSVVSGVTTGFLPQWLYLLSGPALYLRVGELVFIKRKAPSNLPPIFSGNVNTDVSGSFFTLPMTQRPLSTASWIPPFKSACDVGQEQMKITAALTWKLPFSFFLTNVCQT